MSPLRIAAVIPARMASSRLPGKPLLPIRGLPVIEHVRRRAVLSNAFSEVVVATCDREIADVVEKHGGRVLMTSPTHAGATDRVAEAMERLDCTHVVNVQGDEVLVLPSDLARMVEAIGANPEGLAWNALGPIEGPEELVDSSIVKCVVSRSNRVLFCARDFSFLPPGTAGAFEPIRKILGILAYAGSFLARFSTIARTPLELRESIDQSRIIEHDVVLQGLMFEKGYPGINEPREIGLAERYLDEDPRQRRVLREVLG